MAGGFRLGQHRARPAFHPAVVTGWPQKASDTSFKALGFFGGTSFLSPRCSVVFQPIAVMSSAVQPLLAEVVHASLLFVPEQSSARIRPERFR